MSSPLLANERAWYAAGCSITSIKCEYGVSYEYTLKIIYGKARRHTKAK